MVYLQVERMDGEKRALPHAPLSPTASQTIYYFNLTTRRLGIGLIITFFREKCIWLFES